MFFTNDIVLFSLAEVLGISPSKEKFIRVLTSLLTGIPAVLCTSAVPMDGSITDPNTDSQTVIDEPETNKQDLGKASSERFVFT